LPLSVFCFCRSVCSRVRRLFLVLVAPAGGFVPRCVVAWRSCSGCVLVVFWLCSGAACGLAFSLFVCYTLFVVWWCCRVFLSLGVSRGCVSFFFRLVLFCRLRPRSCRPFACWRLRLAFVFRSCCGLPRRRRRPPGALAWLCRRCRPVAGFGRRSGLGRCGRPFSRCGLCLCAAWWFAPCVLGCRCRVAGVAGPFGLGSRCVWALCPGWCLVGASPAVSFVSPAVAVRSAFRAGGFAGVWLRASRRSPSGVVLVCLFGSAARAGVFASLWARRLGRSVSVRPVSCAGGLRWGVSLPVAGCVPFPSASASPAARASGAVAWPVVGRRSLAALAVSVSVRLL
jgi:hypothetical protein